MSKPPKSPLKRTLSILRWIKFQSLSEWLEENLYLSKGKVKGFFKLRTAPHLRLPMQMIDKTHINIVVMKVSSQTQKTTTGIGAILKWIDTDYHDMFIMLPRANDIKKFLDFKITPMINGCKVVFDAMKDYRQKESERKHSHFYKTAKNLLAVISINDTKSITTKYGVFDEAAEFPAGIISEALERMKEYGESYKALMLSTQINEDDEINHFYNICEVKMRYELFCCHCEGHFHPEPEHLVFPSIEEYKDKFNISEGKVLSYNEIMSDYKPYASRKAHLLCPCCGEKITNKQRADAILEDKCEWFQVEASEEDEYGVVTYQRSKIQKDYFESIGLEVNTALAPRVPLKNFASKEIECKYSPPHKRDVLYDKFYVGWWNKIYKPTTLVKTKHNDILRLSNGLDAQMVHEDTNALHLGVDLQKNRLYYVVAGVRYVEADSSQNLGSITLDVVEHGEWFVDDDIDDFENLEQTLEKTWYDKNGKAYRLTSAGADIRGFSQKEENSRSSQMINFIFRYVKKLKDHGVVGWDNFLFPMMGENELQPQHEVEGYRLRARTRDIPSDGFNEAEKLKINDLVFSNKRTKDTLFSLIERGVAKSKDIDGGTASKYNTNLFYINEDIVGDAKQRQEDNPTTKRENNVFESHLTSEHLTYKISDGKVAKKMTYEKKQDWYRNDYLDCLNEILVQIWKFRTHTAVKPKPPTEDKKKDYKSRLKGAI